MSKITTARLRHIVAEAVGNAEASDLRDRLQRELRRNGDTNTTHRSKRRYFVDKVGAWASENLQESFGSAKPFSGYEAFCAFCHSPYARMVGIQKTATGGWGKPTLFYKALEEAGLRLSHDGVRVTLPDLELVPRP